LLSKLKAVQLTLRLLAHRLQLEVLGNIALVITRFQVRFSLAVTFLPVRVHVYMYFF